MNRYTPLSASGRFLAFCLLLFGLLIGHLPAAQASDPTDLIVTVAGTSVGGYLGDGGPATAAQLRQPNDLAIDGAGNIYIADFDNHRVRKIDPSGIITTVAGNLGAGYNGDGIPATAATLYAPYDVAVDAAGNLFISETLNQRIRKVDTHGIITTVAGTGSIGDEGDGGLATAARLRNPNGIALDSQGNLYIADHLNQRIRKVDTNGFISTVAGSGNSGYSGDGGAATAASSLARIAPGWGGGCCSSPALGFTNAFLEFVTIANRLWLCPEGEDAQQCTMSAEVRQTYLSSRKEQSLTSLPDFNPTF